MNSDLDKTIRKLNDSLAEIYQTHAEDLFIIKEQANRIAELEKALNDYGYCHESDDTGEPQYVCAVCNTVLTKAPYYHCTDSNCIRGQIQAKSKGENDE
jgi:hypothetical protein